VSDGNMVKYSLLKDKSKGFERGNIIWKNFFKFEARTIVELVILAILIIGYKVDMGRCDDVITNPCLFCAKSGCCSQPYYDTLLAFYEEYYHLHKGEFVGVAVPISYDTDYNFSFELLR
jgi:hypothetical protein